MRWIMKLTIKMRLFISFGLLLVMFLGVGAYNMKATNDIGHIIEVMYNHLLKSCASLTMQATVLDIQRNLYDMLHTDDNEGNYQSIEATQVLIDEHIAIMRERALDPDSKQQIDILAAKWEDWQHKVVNPMIAFGRQNRFADAGRVLDETVEKDGAEFDEIIGNAVELFTIEGRGFKDESELTVDKVIKADALALIAVTILILFCSILVTISITRPLNQMVNTFKKIAQTKKLTEKIDLDSRCELKTLSENFNILLDTMSGAITLINNQVSDLSEQNKSLMNMADESANNAEGQRRRTEQVATAMNEMTASIAQVADMATNASQEMQAAVEQCEDGQGKLGSCVGYLNQLAEESERVSTQIEKLRQDTDNIGNVLDVINTIAAQTNLLALNAAIEAARAGEQGRGFAVVADEVRTLAQRTQDSTDEIRSTIESLQQSSSIREYDPTNNKYIETGGEARRLTIPCVYWLMLYHV